MNNVSIIPVILAESEEEYKEKLDKITGVPEFTGGWVQIDIVDGKFASNKSVGLDIIKKYPLPSNTEIHLMVQKPDEWIKALIELGAKRIIFPIEVGNTEKLLTQIKSFGIEAGVGLNPETKVAKVAPFIDKMRPGSFLQKNSCKMDIVLLLAVHPGFGGQEFIQEVLEKIREVSRLRPKNKLPAIEVDGGISAENVSSIIKAGADNLAIGEHLINNDITENLEKIWEAANL